MSPEQKAALIQYRINRAKETIEDARIALNNNRIHNALNRIYYAGFYIVSALAVKNDFSTSKHKQLLGWFNRNYISNQLVKPDIYKIFSLAFDNRQESDYEDFAIFEKEDAERYFDNMLIFIDEIEKLINS